jgi:RNA polymerase sigma-70 factor (sigma-E family)
MDWDAEFTLFVRESADALYRTAWLLVGERAGASDLVQDTLTHLYVRWDKVLEARIPGAYVRRAMINRFLSQARHAKASEVVVADVPDAGLADPGMVQVLDRAMIAGPLAALPPRQRAAITLRYYEDLSDRDAARAMGCPVLTLRSHVRRGLAALRAQLDGAEQGRVGTGQEPRRVR